ncbi:hypothetical protein TNCV_3469681 [Trichonephila clavipes]|nr:hypothetical protein TNCV_3469681 [Trichonephila clavipes]
MRSNKSGVLVVSAEATTNHAVRSSTVVTGRIIRKLFQVAMEKKSKRLKSRKRRSHFFFSTTETLAESVPEPAAIDNMVEEVVELARQIRLELDSDNIQEQMNSHN